MISITGTPGTGKTVLSWYLTLFFKHVYDINKLAIRHFSIEFDVDRKSHVIDIDALAEYISKNFPKDSILIGHLSHLLGIAEKIIVLRTHPKELENRLKRKGWPERKIRENLEAEAMNIITYEALELTNRVFEVDTTNIHPREVLYQTLEIIYREPNEFRAPKFDWSEAILEWY